MVLVVLRLVVQLPILLSTTIQVFLVCPDRRDTQLAVSNELVSYVCVAETLELLFKNPGRAAVF